MWIKLQFTIYAKVIFIFTSYIQSSSPSVVNVFSSSMSEGINLKGLREFHALYVNGKLSPDCTTAYILPLVKGITMADPSRSSRRGSLTVSSFSNMLRIYPPPQHYHLPLMRLVVRHTSSVMRGSIILKSSWTLWR